MPPSAKSDPEFTTRLTAVRELVKAHKALEEPLAGAIWLSSENDGVWLLEVLPSLPPDTRVNRPMEFIPSRQFPYTLRLFTGRESDFMQAIDRDVKLAAAIASGKPIPKRNEVTKRLQARAAKAVKKRAR